MKRRQLGTVAFAAAVLICLGCAQRSGYPGGAYTTFTFSPASAGSRVQQDTPIARDERLLAEDAGADPETLLATLRDLMARLCAAQDYQELDRVQKTYTERGYGAALRTYTCVTVKEEGELRSPR